VPSSAIRRFDYDGAAETLDVTFVSGRRYRYFGVSAEVVQGLQTAPSQGRFFNLHVRDRFACEDRTRRRPRAVLQGAPGR
jgi:lysyl-tRNA synthetase class 2